MLCIIVTIRRVHENDFKTYGLKSMVLFDNKKKIQTYGLLTFFDCFGIISTDGPSAIADTTGVCGGSSIQLDSI